MFIILSVLDSQVAVLVDIYIQYINTESYIRKTKCICGEPIFRCFIAQ